MKPRIKLHLTPDGLANWRHASRFEFYQAISKIATERGIDFSVERMTQSSGPILQEEVDQCLHFVHGGSVDGIGWLNSSLAYLPGFWHINPEGILADSPARNRSYLPDLTKKGKAEQFMNRLRRRFAIPRVSRYRQKSAVTALPTGCIAIFLQGRYPYIHKQCFMSMEEMLREVFSDETLPPIVIKPHPLETSFGLQALERANLDRSRYLITDANVHDILESAAVIVSVNSSVTFEGFMHAKPSIVFGRTDYQSLVVTVRDAGEFSNAFKLALSKDWDFAGMIHWYFKSNTIQIGSKSFERRLSREVRKSGLDPRLFRLDERLI
jgi:Capsule polysaccharide biosynthesis protein